MHTARRMMKIIGVVAALSALVAYGGYEFRNYFAGPIITVFLPLPGTVTENVIAVSGEARSISRITLNGRPIFIDEDGAFNERLPLLSGYNRITLRAEDRFGNETQVIREVVLADPPAVLGETTPATGTSTKPI